MVNKNPKQQSKAKNPTRKPKAVEADTTSENIVEDAKKTPKNTVASQSKSKASSSRKIDSQKSSKGSSEPLKTPTSQRPRLELRYVNEIRKMLVEDFNFSSPMQAPRFSKVVVNMGLGEALTNAKALETAPWQLGVITGQHPVVTKARRSIAGFKVREGQSIGCMVTLRGSRMYEFLDRLINVALPRIRDFRGVSRNAFDGQGNYSLGLRDQSIFPELDYGSIDRSRGLQVVINTTAKNDREGFRLLELIGLPFAREGQIR
jgi:large subunit ribosomal protein L5